MELLLVTLASGLAGFVDAIVGGGGLILVPALFATYVAANPATLLGTNKSASVWGTSFATWQYSRRIALPWRKLILAVAVTWVGSWLGAYALTLMSPDFLRKLLPLIMLLVLAYTLARKDLGHTHAPRWQGRQETLALCLIGMVIGAYDGFFGPGTGSFLIFLFIRFFHFDFLRASACAKVVNLTTNLAALAFFVPAGLVLYSIAIPMGLANIAGAQVGTRLALKGGNAWVRRLFLLLALVLLAKLSYDQFRF